MRDKIIFTSIFSFLVGIFLRSFLNIQKEVIVILVITSFLFLIFFFFKRNKNLILISLSIIFIVIGFLRYSFYDQKQNKNIFDEFVGSEVEFRGVVEEFPEKRENSQRLIVSFDEVRVLVSTELYPEFSYGDLVNVSGKLSKPENFITDVGKEFDYVNYLSKDRIFYNISFAKVSLEEKEYKRGVNLFLFKVRKSFTDTLEKLIPSPQSSLLNGLLLGQKESLGKELENNFIKTGLIHIVVLSGYNVTIIAESIIRTLSFLPRLTSLLIGSTSIILFAFMTGLGTTVVRASIMAIIALWARFSGNGYNITRALVIAGFLMVLHNPYILYFDLSFHLSFLATLGLIYLSPLVEKYFNWVRFQNIRQIIGATFATQIFVLPFILYKIGILSIIAPITNVIVLPTVPITMFFGFMSGAIGQLSLILAKPFAFISSILLSFQIFVVEFFGKLNFAAFSVRNFSIILVFAFYVFLFWFIIKNNKIENNGN